MIIPPSDLRTVGAHGFGTTGSTTVLTVPNGETWTMLSGSIDRTNANAHTWLSDNVNPSFMTSVLHTSGDHQTTMQGSVPIQGDVVLNWTNGIANTHHWTNITYVPYNVASTTYYEELATSTPMFEDTTATTTVLYQTTMTYTVLFVFFLLMVGVFAYIIKKLT